MDPQHLVIEATGAGEAPLRPPRRAAGVQGAMTLVNDLVNDLAAGSKNRLSLPEYRQIELYSKRKSLNFAEAEPGCEGPLSLISGVCRAFFVLDAYLASAHQPTDGETSWRRYLGLPRAGATQKAVAEIYRILRVARTVVFHPQGHVEMTDGIVKINGAVNRVALSLELTPAGLTLLESAVAYYLGSLRAPYSDAYVEAMLTQYYFDIVAEIRRFHDEDRILYQFRRKFLFNRHFRFDCDNPKTQFDDGALVFEIGAAHENPALYPIDFYVEVGHALHIIPVEALSRGGLPLTDLDKWRVRGADANALPADFRLRFGREVMVVGQPMT